VTRELTLAPEHDVRAIAVYIAFLTGKAPAATAVDASPDHSATAAQGDPKAEALFAGACATCHEAGAPMMAEGRPALALGTPLHEAQPRDTIQILLHGLKSPAGRAGPAMPAFAGDFDDAQIASLTAYLRARYTDETPWPHDLTGEVREARKVSEP
jgi:mono/diheme cytochrome c family protein